jgi:Tol biopolymer transport system component
LADLGKTIGIYGLDGVRQKLLDVPPGCAEPGDLDPVWSADGSSLVVVGCEVPVDGRTPRSLSPQDLRSLARPAFSPDGTQVAYTWTGQLTVASADGSQHRVLGSTRASSARWAPTGDRIAFVGAGPSGQDELDVVEVATGLVTSLASSTPTDHLDVIGFAPAGDRILFSRSNTNFNGTGLWSIGVDGSAAKLLVAGTNWGDWQWQPAGP